MIAALVAKDLSLFFRNRFFAFISILGLVFYIGIYLAMPDTVDEDISLALVAPQAPTPLLDAFAEDDISVVTFDDEAALRTAILDGDYEAGIVLQDDTLARLATGDETRVDLYLSADAPQELNDAITTLVRMAFNNASYALSGQPLRIQVQEEVIGPNLLGQAIPPRDRMLPLFAVVMLVMETLGLASLMTEEIEGRTLQALLVTPLRMSQLFIGKGIAGAGLAFVQVVLLMLITGGLREQPLLILFALLLGAVMVTGIGFLLASVARDMLSVLGWGVLALLLLALPAFNVLLPGMLSGWVQVLPSFYLVDLVHQVANFGAGWADVTTHLLVLLASSVVFFALGVAALRRKLQ